MSGSGSAIEFAFLGSELNTVHSIFITGKIKRMMFQSENELENWIKNLKRVCLKGS